MQTNQEIAASYFKRLSVSLKSIPLKPLSELASKIEETRDLKGSVLICGNGGSSATASHMQVDLAFGVTPGVRARCLNDNSASLTSTGNDLSFDEVFSRQIELEADPRDLLIVISASGNSKNLLLAVAAASRIGVTTSAIVGFNGGKLKLGVDIPIHCPTETADYGVAEDLHASINHALKEILNGGLASKAP
jgi:D-sedoheptulose 7-phosphate isomerase